MLLAGQYQLIQDCRRSSETALLEVFSTTPVSEEQLQPLKDFSVNFLGSG